MIFVDPWGLAASTVPGWLDWNKDGTVDTTEQRDRFDKNNNDIADWIDLYDGKSAAREMYTLGIEDDVVMLENFVGFTQIGSTCYPTSAASAIRNITGKKTIKGDTIWKDYQSEGGDISDLTDEYNLEKYINKKGYLSSVGYVAYSESGLSGFVSFDELVKNINLKRPIVLGLGNIQHAVAAIGYAYDEKSGKQFIITYNSQDYKGGIQVNEFNTNHYNSAIFFGYLHDFVNPEEEY